MHPIGQAAALSGVKIETIRYYEREDIVPPAERSVAGRRLYDDAAIARLRFVRRCRDLGFPIPTIRDLLDLSSNSDDPCESVKLIGEQHLADIRNRIADLQRLESALTNFVAECNREQDGCPALRLLFAD